MKLFLSALLLFIASVSLAAQSDREKQQIESDVKRIVTEQVAAWNSGDIDGFMRGYWNSDKLVFISGDSVTRGWRPTLDRYKKIYDSRAKMGTLTFSGLEVNVVSRDAAIVLGSWALQRDGDNPHGKFTLTFRKFKDGWRIVMDHTS